MVYPLGVEQRRPALDAVDFIALLEQELGQVAAVLAGDAGDAGDESCFQFWLPDVLIFSAVPPDLQRTLRDGDKGLHKIESALTSTVAAGAAAYA
jgi:hypothetical protein